MRLTALSKPQNGGPPVRPAPPLSDARKALADAIAQSSVRDDRGARIQAAIAECEALERDAKQTLEKIEAADRENLERWINNTQGAAKPDASHSERDAAQRKLDAARRELALARASLDAHVRATEPDRARALTAANTIPARVLDVLVEEAAPRAARLRELLTEAGEHRLALESLRLHLLEVGNTTGNKEAYGAAEQLWFTLTEAVRAFRPEPTGQFEPVGRAAMERWRQAADALRHNPRSDLTPIIDQQPRKEN